MKVALVHDYLREYGGAERVIEAMHEIWPEAPLYTSFIDWQTLGEFGYKFRGWDIRASWVDRNWLVKKYHSPLRFLTPLVWESLDLRGFDVVISSSGWYICRGVVTRPETLHISYIHHPPRNLYGYPTGRKPNALVSAYAAFINPFLRVYDFATAQRVDHLIANSRETAARIKKFYRREATVIYPPVEIPNSKFQIPQNKTYFLCVGRLTYAKRIDLAILACNELKLPLKIVGVGKEEAELKALAGPTVEFLGSLSDEELDEVYQSAKGLIFTALHEDFGMVPVEAMARGVPVIALRQGGVEESIVEGETGIFYDAPDKELLKRGLVKFSSMNFKTETIINQAKKFSKEKFKGKLATLVKEKYNQHALSSQLHP
ncbi:glycosyltransferase [Candidatus Gottesmanbacteria bacterium]|nr:glycosyltransferase [Candidatus Gottesmanbacteria bacterium]